MTTEEDRIAFEAKTEEEKDKIRSGSVCCPAGHPEVWNPSDCPSEWRWNIRAYKVQGANGLWSSYCRACRRPGHGEDRTGRWFNDNGWED